MELILIIFSSYLVGSIPFGYILTKFFLKKDIREIGSGNIGATNALRTGNKAVGFGTLVLDISKAILPLVFININYLEYIFVSSLCIFIASSCFLSTGIYISYGVKETDNNLIT